MFESKEELAELYGVSVEDIYYCDICECLTAHDEDGYPFCSCV